MKLGFVKGASAQMKLLEERIMEQGQVRPGNVLKVDCFLNHQLDVELLDKIGEEFYRIFKNDGINKILTIEASGIAIACMTARHFNVPVVFAKKKKPSTMENMLVTKVFSFTKNNTYDVCVCKDYLQPGDKVLFIDDFLANGNAAKGVMDLVRQSGAELSGMGFLIEKAFQHGGDYLRAQGIHVESLAVIESLEGCRITLKE